MLALSWARGLVSGRDKIAGRIISHHSASPLRKQGPIPQRALGAAQLYGFLRSQERRCCWVLARLHRGEPGHHVLDHVVGMLEAGRQTQESVADAELGRS